MEAKIIIGKNSMMSIEFFLEHRDGLRFCFLSALESTTAPWTEFKGKRVSLGCSSAPHHRKAQPLMLLGPAFVYVCIRHSRVVSNAPNEIGSP
ncbi:hypothetical protein V1477_011266 [Vespula maculifrons]|uniref:Uncharacterized protein n=1 Tax=Vespula maculifrons TaxID=7453 RepID=A0ABD2C4A6_VESMC